MGVPLDQAETLFDIIDSSRTGEAGISVATFAQRAGRDVSISAFGFRIRILVLGSDMF